MSMRVSVGRGGKEKNREREVEFGEAQFFLRRKLLRYRCVRGGGVVIATSLSWLIGTPAGAEVVMVKLGLAPKLVVCCAYVSPFCSEQTIDALYA